MTLEDLKQRKEGRTAYCICAAMWQITGERSFQATSRDFKDALTAIGFDIAQVYKHCAHVLGFDEPPEDIEDIEAIARAAALFTLGAYAGRYVDKVIEQEKTE